MSRNTKAVLVAVPVILFLLAAAIPNFIPPRATLSTNACANNLRWLQKAKTKWAHDLNKPDTAVPSEGDLRPVLKAMGAGDFYPQCPSGGTYSIGAVSQPVACSVREPGHTCPAD
jgi:hypothetical protein